MKKIFCLIFIAAVVCSCNQAGVITKTENRQYALSKTSQTDSSFYNLIKPYRDSMSVVMDIVIGQSESAMEKGQPESKLGNFVADLALVEANKNYYPGDNKKADFAFLNNGGLRSSMPQGAITRGKVFEMMPFENELIIVTLNGSTMNKLIQYIIDKGGVPVSNLHLKIRDKKAVEVKINQQDFDSLKTYKVVTSDYLVNGGDNLTLMSEEINRESLGLKLRDAIIDYIQQLTASGKKIAAQKEGRIVYEQ